MGFTTEAREGHKLDLAVDVLRSGGAIRLQALGSSMLPSIWPGDVLRIEAKRGENLVPGDIALALRDGRFFVHRLVEKHNSNLITRADSLLQNDEPIVEAQVLGKVSLICRKAEIFVPTPPLSPFGRRAAWMLCRSDLFRSIALRMHAIARSRGEERSKSNAGGVVAAGLSACK